MRGEQERLAEAMGINGDKLSKILAGKRRVQSSEVPGAVSFFQQPDEVEWQSLIEDLKKLSPEDQERVRSLAANLRAAQGS